MPYSQPYGISAIGDPAALQGALDANPYVQGYRDAADPEISVGWAMQQEAEITAPAYGGLLRSLSYARPAAD